MNKIILKECPFCGGDDLGPRLLLGSNRFYHIMCVECGATGPLEEEYDSKKKGIELASVSWNKRKTGNK